MIPFRNDQNWLDYHAGVNPDNPALISGNSILSFAELRKECIGIASHLRSIGVTPNNNIAILCGNNPGFVKLVLAAWYAGAIPVPLNARNLAPEAEKQIKYVNAKVLLFDPSMEELAAQINFENKISIPFPLENSSGSIIQDIYAPANPSLILFTSGTTGYLKAVVHTFDSLYSSCFSLDSECNFSTGDKWLASLPFYHIGGFMILVRSLISGTGIVLPGTLKTPDIMNAMAIFNPNYMSLVTTNFREMINAGSKPHPELKRVFLGGGPIDAGLSLNAVQQGWPVTHVYGSTETAAMVTMLNHWEIEKKSESAGKPLQGIDVLISGGEIIVKSKSLFREYYKNRDVTNSKLKNDFYYTGDYGYLDNEGYLYVESRREDIIISGGENVSVSEVKKALESHPGIDEAVVFAIEDEKWGQKVTAAIVLDKNENQTEEMIHKYLSERLPAYKIPKKIIFINEIPRGPLGKINLIELKRRLISD